jgi:signal peptidase II
VLGILAVDQASKRLIIDNLALGETREPLPAISDFFQITHSINPGAAFGFLPQASDLFLVIAIVVVLGMFYFYPRLPEEAHPTRIGMGMLCGGALGNAVDRLVYGHVIDFIHYRFPPIGISNVSNFADHMIVMGVIIVLIDSWRLDRIQQRKTAEAEAEAETEAETEVASENPD